MRRTLVIENDPAPTLEVEELESGPALSGDSDAESVTTELVGDDNPIGGSDSETASDGDNTESEDENNAGGSDDDASEDGNDAASDDDTVVPKVRPPVASVGSANPPAALVLDTDDDGNLTESDDEDWNERLKQGGLIAEDGTLGSELLAQHPETQTVNVDEVRAAANVIRNSAGVIIDPNHRTTPLITRYEKAKILGIRAEQLSSDGQPAIDIPNDGMSSWEIAYAEYRAGKIPFIIRRPLPSGKSEYWRVADLQDVSY